MGKKRVNPKLAILEEQARLEREEAERLKRLAEEREARLQLIRNEIRENNLRLALLEESDQVFTELLKNVKKFKNSVQVENLWKKFIACNLLPDTQNPAVVRSFLYRFFYDYENYQSHHLNWWLNCDEKSLLTQDTDIPNTTRSFIKTIREPTGKFYDQKLRFMMKVYESLEETLRRQKVSDERLKDLITIRDEMREIIFDFLDALTCEIIMHIDREMDSMTPHAAHYSYASPDFIKFIWSFKDVTLPVYREKLKKIVMKPLKMTVTMSSELDLESTCVRALWFKRDVLSDYCQSFLPSRSMEFQSLSVAIEREMMVKKYMRKMKLDALRETRAIYDQKMKEKRRLEEVEAEANMKNKKKKNPKTEPVKMKKKKKARILIEPPIVDESTYLNVDEQYEEYEKNEADNDKAELSPEHLNLEENEVNMRKFQIINGIYKIECLERPIQTKQLGDRIFIRLSNRPNTLKYQNFTHTYQKPMLNRVKDERMSMYFADKFLIAQTKALAVLTKVEITLPTNFIWFEPPIVCRWEENDKKFIAKEQEKPIKKIDHRTFNDFPLSSSQTTVKLSALVKHYLIPIMPVDEFLYHHEKLELFEMKQRAWRLRKEQEAMSGHEEMKKASIEALSTLDEFLKYFEMKHMKPRTLFPKIIERKVNVEVDENMIIKVKKVRKELREAMQLDSMIKYPIDEPMMLSELLRKIEEIQVKLIPIFKETIAKTKISQKITSSSTAASACEESSKLNDLLKTEDNDVSKSASTPYNKGKWTTNDIYEANYDGETRTLSFYTGKYGVFALPVRKYLHLLFKFWECYPVIDDKKAVVVKIETQYLTLEFKITDDGFTFKILKPGRVPVQEITKPVKFFRLKKLLSSLNMNFFPEIDACHYIDDITEKHHAMEFHTYKSMANFCLLLHYKYDRLNSVVDRRKIIINYKPIERNVFKKILISPLRVQSIVENEVDYGAAESKLPFKIDPLEQEFHPDPLTYMKCDIDRVLQRQNQRHFMTFWYTQALLQNLRLLSFSE